MKQNFSFIYKVFLLVGDILALLLSFTFAYILRVSLDPRPVSTPVDARTYIMFIGALLPIWISVFYVLGLYSRRVYERRPREASRLFVGSIFGVLLFVSYDFFSSEVIFPAKLIPVYAALLSFVTLWTIRTILRGLRLYLYNHGYGITRVLLIGNSDTTYYLSKYLSGNVSSGIDVVAVVANIKYVHESATEHQYRSALQAISATNPHAIIQTDGDDVTKIYNLAIENHLDYQFIPSHSALFTARHSVELLGAFPIINVHTTPLIGYGRALKRAVDIAGSIFGLLITSPFLLAITLIMKLSSPSAPVFFKQKRLSRFNKKIHIFKFRSLSLAYNGLSPEEAFTKMGKPELIQAYRDGGDQLENDPRITRIGNFLRKTSLDELPQLFNVLRGDISLVGPRALVPQELDDYEFKSLILSVKSGLTGLAQISGRKDISFEERRKLDMYYVQNWSIWLDLRIILQTIFSVLTGRGAK